MPKYDLVLRIKDVGYFSGINKALNIFYFECVFIINLCVQLDIRSFMLLKG